MMRSSTFHRCLCAGALILVGILSGCAGLEYAPKRGILYYHQELPVADRAIEAARTAGKDKECPAEFQAAEKARNEAYEIYWSCRTQEGIAKANEAAGMAKALCPKKMAPPPPPPPPPPPAPTAPTVSLSANPAAIVKGNCTTLSWSSANANRASITPGIGDVEPSGTKQVCPDVTTRYSITASGEGGSATTASTVDVSVPPPPPAKTVIDRLTVHVNFDSDKAKVREDDEADLKKAVDFLRKYPGFRVSIEGHTDSRGSGKYNQALSEKRAAAVKQYLLGQGIGDGEKISTAGYGESRPVADNATEKGRFENRRVEILILSE